jgi:hypothetical protein
MRSELVTQAAAAVANRFLLVHVASLITRKFHLPTKDRLPESINNSLAGLGERRYFVCPDLTIAGIVTPEATAVAIATGQLKPAESAMVLTAFTSLATGLPYFPPESAPVESEQAAETA